MSEDNIRNFTKESFDNLFISLISLYDRIYEKIYKTLVYNLFITST